MTKVLVGLRDGLVVLLDMDTDKKAMRAAVTAGCDQIIQCEITDQIRQLCLSDVKVKIKLEVSEDGNV